MAEITVRLRNTPSRSKRDLMDDAASEIERLENELATAVANLEYIMEYPDDRCAFCKKADADCIVCKPEWIGAECKSCGGMP